MTFELQKCLSKLWKPLLVLLAINAVVCLWVTRDDPRVLPEDSVTDFFALYAENAERMDEEYRLGVSRTRQDSRYAPEGFSDFELFREVYSRIEYIEDYRGELQKIIDDAGLRAAGADGYQRRVYENVISLYARAKDGVVLGLEYTRGWTSYFGYRAGDFLLLILLVYLSSTLFTHEKTCGFLPLLRSVKNGRTRTAAAKICVLTVVTAAVFLLFTAETWLLFLFRVGFSSPDNGIQIFGALKLCPYVMTVGQFFLLSLAVRLCAFLGFSLAAALVSVSVYNPVAEFVAGSAMVGISLLLYLSRPLDPDGLLSNVGLLSSLEVIPLFARYRAVNFFGYPVSYPTVLTLVFVPALLVLPPAIILRYNVGSGVLPDSWLNRIDGITGAFREFLERTLPRARHKPSLSLFTAETYKTLFLRHALLFAAILFAAKLFLSAAAYKPPVSYSDAVYKEYMQILAGEATEEKRLYLTEERRRISEILESFEELQKRYIDGDMPAEEYQKVLSDYNTALGRDSVLSRVEDRLIYIDTQKEEGREAWFVYDTGWNKLFFQDFDWTLFFALLVPFCGVFASEYNGTSSSFGFAGILRTTKNGRRKTLTDKYLSVMCLSAVWIALWTAADLFFLLRAYELPVPDAPLCSLESTEGFAHALTLRQYGVLMLAARSLLWIAFAVLVCSLSEVLKKRMSVLSAAAIFALVPELLVYFGLTAFRGRTFVSLTQVTPTLVSGTAAPLCLGICAVAAVSAYAAGKSWGK